VGNITTQGLVGAGFEHMWNQITPENESKWGSVEASKGQLEWGPVDAIYDFANQHDIAFKLHPFVWGSQQPDWVASTSGSELAERVENFMQEACNRYPDVAMIDVVNEPPPHTDPSQVREALGGAGASGYDWIVNAFSLARKHCPNAILILNDYNNIEWPTDQDNFVKIATAVKGAGAPVDALGAQAHDAYMRTAAELRTFIDKLASVGLPLYITEYDIDEADDAKQQQIMSEQFPLFWNDDRIKGITLWGYVHGATWKPNTGLVRNGLDRPAMTWLKEFLTAQGAL
jgi:endo-1,4-beta-xylanase